MNGRLYQLVTGGCFAILVALYLVASLLKGRPPSTDEVFFKGPGLSWALGGPWAAREEPDFFPPTVQPGIDEVFFTYPPAYPFGFGLVVKLFGFGWRQCIVYDSIIHLALMASFACFFKQAGEFTRRHRWLLLSGLLFAGTTGRPDELAMLFGYLGCIIANQTPFAVTKSFALWTSNLLLGMCAVTSVPCLISLGAIRFSWILFSPQTTKRKLWEAFTLTLTIVLFWACATAWVIGWHSGALQQNVSASLASIRESHPSGLSHLLAYHREAFFVGMLLLAAGITQLVWVKGRAGLFTWCRWWLAPLVTWLFFFSRYQFQGFYYWFWTPWMLAAVFSAGGQLAPKKLLAQARQMPLLVGTSIVVTFLGLQGMRFLCISLLTQKKQTLALESPLVRSLIPTGSRVLTWAHWWSLGDQCIVTDTFVAGKLSPSDIDYIVLTSHGAGTPGIHHPLPQKFQEAIARGEFKIVRSNLDSNAPHFFGVRLSNSAWGAGSVVYAAVAGK